MVRTSGGPAYDPRTVWRNAAVSTKDRGPWCRLGEPALVDAAEAHVRAPAALGDRG